METVSEEVSPSDPAMVGVLEQISHGLEGNFCWSWWFNGIYRGFDGVQLGFQWNFMGIRMNSLGFNGIWDFIGIGLGFIWISWWFYGIS